MARCPNCTESLHRSAEGEYPPKCPKCGVRLKSKSKKVSPAAILPSKPAPKTVEERVVRSFSARQPEIAEPFIEPLPADPLDEAPDTVHDHNFGTTPNFDGSPLSTAELSIPQPLVENPFAPAPTLSISSSDAAPKEVAVNPFGGTAPVVVAPARPNASNIVRWSIVGVMIASAAGVGVYFGKDLFSKPVSKERPGYHNPGRFYVFYALPSPWKEDKARAARAGFDLALHRADLGAWVTLRTEAVKDVVIDPKDVADEAVVKWKDRFPDFKESGTLGKAKLASEDAVVVEGEGTLKDVPIRGRTLILIAGGVKYQLGLEAPVSEWEQLERDFTLARDSLELTGGAVAPIKTLGDKDVTVFASKRFPYRLSAPAKTWREVPELQTDSRFDDLKLQDRARLGEIVIQPRETKDLPGMRVSYLNIQTKRYDEKVREVETSIESLSIRGRKALRTLLIVSNTGGDIMLYTTFVQGDGMVFQIQGRAPVDKRDFYEPLFAQIVDSFEVLDKAPEQPKKEEPPAAPEKSEPAKAEKTEAANPPMKAADAEKKADPPKKEAAKPSETTKPKEPEKKPIEKKDDAKKTDAPKKKKSLDDLD
jgi:hypothetical protein